MSKTPQEELKEFLAPLPSYMRKALCYEKMSSQELLDQMHGMNPFTESQLQELQLNTGWQPDGRLLNENELRPQLERILQRMPAEWQKYKKNATKARDSFADWYAQMPQGKPGPKENRELAERIWKLDAEGKTNREIQQILNADGENLSLAGC